MWVFILLKTHIVILKVAKNFKDGHNVDFYVSHVINTPVVSLEPVEGEVEEHKSIHLVRIMLILARRVKIKIC